MKKKILKFFKKDVVKFFMIDLVFFALLGGLLLYARNKITSYILQWMAYAEQVSQLSQVIQEQGVDALGQVESLASVVEPLAFKLYLSIYVLIPLGILLIWCISQGLNYNILSKKKLFDWKAAGRFLLLNVPFFVVLFLLVEFFFTQMTAEYGVGMNFYMMGIILLAVLLIVYFMQVMYVFLHKKHNVVKLMKHSLKLAVYKSHKLFPLTLVSVLIFFLAFIFLWNIMIKMVASTSGYILSIIFLIVSIFLWGAYRKFLVNFIRKA